MFILTEPPTCILCIQDAIFTSNKFVLQNSVNHLHEHEFNITPLLHSNIFDDYVLSIAFRGIFRSPKYSIIHVPSRWFPCMYFIYYFQNRGVWKVICCEEFGLLASLIQSRFAFRECNNICCFTKPDFHLGFQSLDDFESETDQSWTSSPIPSPILTWFEHRDRFRVRFRVLSQETRYFESETPIFHIKPVEISPNFKSETRESFTPSPIPSLRLGYP